MAILIVDDEADLRDLISMVITSRLRVKTLTAGSVAEAIRLIETTDDIQGVLCDYNLKPGTGADIFRYLRDHHRPIPFVLCSGDALENHKDFAEMQVAGFLAKPFLAKEIVSIVQSSFKI